MDRDEARFATASKTMMETKNFIDIKMQDEVRYKKPVGIYWLQSISNYFFGEPPERFGYIGYRQYRSYFINFFIYNFVRKEYATKMQYCVFSFYLTNLNNFRGSSG